MLPGVQISLCRRKILFSSYYHKNMFGTFSGLILHFRNFLSVQLLLNFVVSHTDSSHALSWQVHICIREAMFLPC